MDTYSVVVPVYNGEQTVSLLFEKIKGFFKEYGYYYEVIFVYDCGPDKSWDVLLELKEKYPEEITLVKLSRNFGQHNALISGFEYTRGDFIITMDEDLQHDPDDIYKLINKQKEKDYDVVYGKYEEKKHSFFRNMTSTILKKLIEKSIPEINTDYSAYRLIKRDIAKSTIEMRNSYTFLDGYLSWITTNTTSCLVSHNERQGGTSAYTLKKLINHSINIFVTFSEFPIRLVSKTSLLILFFVFAFAIYVILRKLIYNDFAVGYPSLVLIIGFGIGIIMLALGIIGEYIYKINLKTTKRPNYIVKEVV